jgi:ABC-type transport system substrate-binding protein
LGAVGLNVLVQGVPLSQVFTYQADSASARPDMMIQDGNPDSGTPDVYIRPLQGTYGVPGDGSLNFYRCVIPGIDRLIDTAAQQPSLAASAKYYAEAGEEAVQLSCFQPFVDIEEGIVMRSNFSNVKHVAVTPWSIPFGLLTYTP